MNTEDKQNMIFKHDYPELDSVYDFKNKKLTPNIDKINFVVSHGGCSDGFTSATIVRQWMTEKKMDLEKVTFYNAYYGSDFSKLPEMMKDKHVIICDFSFPKILFDEMIIATNGNILILDHHESAQNKLRYVPPEYVVFDMKHSGAFITWVYFNGFYNVPKTVLSVEDNDIWTKALPNTKEFTGFMQIQPFSFDAYDKFFDEKYLSETVFPYGAGIVMRDDANIAQLSKKAIPVFMMIGGRYYFIACLNSAILKSELGNHVLSVLPNVNFSMIYSHDQFTGTTNISYRSLDDKTSVSEVAETHGGGGHRNASGAGVSYLVNHPPGRLVDSYRLYYTLNGVYTIDIGDKKFLAFNSSIAKRHMACYLMQERFFGKEVMIRENYDKSLIALTKNGPRVLKNLPGYQEGLFLMRNKLGDQTLDEIYSGAIVWAYDGSTKKYQAAAKFLDNVIIADQLVKLAEPPTIPPIDPNNQVLGNNPMESLLTYESLSDMMYNFTFDSSLSLETLLTTITQKDMAQNP
jgi:oligoribonuclease NrnB/cAMP/cGMP phosphodiesterase (DHH superfamily)